MVKEQTVALRIANEKAQKQSNEQIKAAEKVNKELQEQLSKQGRTLSDLQSQQTHSGGVSAELRDQPHGAICGEPWSSHHRLG